MRELIWAGYQLVNQEGDQFFLTFDPPVALTEEELEYIARRGVHYFPEEEISLRAGETLRASHFQGHKGEESLLSIKYP